MEPYTYFIMKAAICSVCFLRSKYWPLMQIVTGIEGMSHQQRAY